MKSQQYSRLEPSEATQSSWKGASWKHLHTCGDDRLVIEYEITVIKEPRVRQTSSVFDALVPPSDLLDDLSKLLEAHDKAYVIFPRNRISPPLYK
jgi:hypothetical protein